MPKKSNSEPATKGDLKKLETRLDAKFDKLEARTETRFEKLASRLERKIEKMISAAVKEITQNVDVIVEHRASDHSQPDERVTVIEKKIGLRV